MTRLGADVLCTEQYPSTSYARGSPISCYSSQGHSRSNNNQVSTTFPIDALPIEIHLKILQNLSRSDLDNCSLVCRQWASVIKYNKQRLPKHFIKSLILEANKRSFTLTIKTCNFTRQWKLRNSVAMDSKRKITIGVKRPLCNDANEEAPPSKLSSMLVFIDNSGQPTISTSPSPLLVPIYLNESESEVDRLKRKHAMHTPPPELLQRIAHCFKHATVETFRLKDLRITDEFVDLMTETFRKQPIQCNALKMNFCKLTYCTPQKFAKLIKMFKINAISMAWIRGNDEHMSTPEIAESICNHCKMIDICSVTDEITTHNTEFFKTFLNNPHSEKIIRLDSCSVSDTAIIDAIKEWRTSPKILFRNISLSHSTEYPTYLRTYNKVKSYLARLPYSDGSYWVKHPTLPNTLRVWWDGGIHLVSTPNYVS